MPAIGDSTQTQISGATPSDHRVVWSFNEWDPLEEVIVGVVDGAMIQPAGRVGSPGVVDANGNQTDDARMMAAYSGTQFPPHILFRVKEQVERFAQVLASEGIVVRRPDAMPLGKPVQTPYFQASYGYNIMNARDLVMIVGDQIIEAPTASRTRHFETLAYHRIFKEYFRKGARWVSAPRPGLPDQLYDFSFDGETATKGGRRGLTEYEPVFDAADFVRCGRDIFGQRGARTNELGIEWLRRHLYPEFRVHEVETRCPNPVHIDTTFVPIGPGKVLVNPDWIGKLPDAIKGWDILEAPRAKVSVDTFDGYKRETSSWIGMNVFLLDEQRIFVDEQQEDLIRKLKDWGFKPIPLPFELPPLLGGAFHCVTLDIRRRGELKSYI